MSRPVTNGVSSQERLFDSVSIVLVGKYTTLEDSYMSVVKSLEHASMRCGRKLELQVGLCRIPYCLVADQDHSGWTRPTWSHIPRLATRSNTTMLGARSVLPSECGENHISSEDALLTVLGSVRGIIVPGGFGHRGTEGMIAAVKWAREQKVPFLGICLGFQVAVIEWARNVCGLEGEQANIDERLEKLTLMHSTCLTQVRTLLNWCRTINTQ